jgi:DNA repair exonuclease SbcCD ATPase subunit
MVDTISAPASDLCVIEGCGRTRSAHARGTGTIASHMFTTVDQLVTSRPQRRDPFRDIRPMTDQDRQRATDVERAFSETKPPAPSRITEQKQMEKFEEAKPVMRDKRPCAVCGKPRTNHRGGIDHTYEPMGDVAAAAHDKRSELAQRIDELRTELEQHVGMMKQMLG